jgi:hypothetical protein
MQIRRSGEKKTRPTFSKMEKEAGVIRLDDFDPYLNNFSSPAENAYFQAKEREVQKKRR